jgi:hypothetical protein
MPYSLYTGYCHIDLERFRNGSRSFVSNTITPQAAKYNMQHTSLTRSRVSYSQDLVDAILTLFRLLSHLTRVPPQWLALLRLQYYFFSSCTTFSFTHYNCATTLSRPGVSHTHRIRWMSYSLYTGYCCANVERLRNGSRSFVSNTIIPQAA